LIGRYENIKSSPRVFLLGLLCESQSRQVKQAMMKEQYDEGPVKAGHFGFGLTDIIIHPPSPVRSRGILVRRVACGDHTLVVQHKISSQ
jgi:hypothetical protein